MNFLTSIFPVLFILLIISIPSFFIWSWLLKKFIKVEKNRIISTWIATIIMTPLIYICIIMLWIFSISYYPTHKFDKEKWKSDTEKRYELSGDLIENKLLIGKTKDEVILILGNENNTKESDLWNYYLGFVPGPFNIDPDVLDIEFKNGKVIHVGQHET